MGESDKDTSPRGERVSVRHKSGVNYVRCFLLALMKILNDIKVTGGF